MELDKGIFSNIQRLIKETLSSNEEYELEARLLPNMRFYTYENILNSLIFSKNVGGYGLSYTIDTSLDIRIDEYRITINGKDNVKMYWLTDKLNKNIKHRFINKVNINKVDLNEYNMRINLSVEKELDKKTIDNIEKMLNDNNKMKTYRIKNRYHIMTEDGLFKFDLTSVKMADGVSFRRSNVLKKDVNYEVELEYVKNVDIKSDDVDKVFENMFKNINILLKLYNNTNHIIKNSEKNYVMNSYKSLIEDKNKTNYSVKNGNNSLFIAVNPIIINRINLVETYKPNIIKNYAITLKADGLRSLLYILDKVYLIDINMNIRYTGLSFPNWSGTIIEGEYIKEYNTFLCYDILFERDNDIRNLNLIDEKKENSRLGYLELFIKSMKSMKSMKSIVKDNSNVIEKTELNNEFDHKISSSLTIEMKLYKYGSDIFRSMSELWNIDKQSINYKIDGIIFTPTNEKYPTKLGAWNKLFKWKPEEFNSFDFLVKTEKNENGDDIIYPFVVYKENGETLVNQYKSLQLYVGHLEAIVDNGTKKTKHIYKPIEFNPSKNDVGERAKILLDENGKMMVNGMEIMDDTIVEFVYDKNKLSGFNWKPIKIRYDKTDLYKSGEPVYGNNDKTAIDLWENVNNPISFDELSCGTICEIDFSKNPSYYACQLYEPAERLPYQIFHNLVVKRDLILKVAPKSVGRLLDIACGKGGDLSKWVNAGYREIVSIDIDKACIDYAITYYNDFVNDNKPIVKFMIGDMSKAIFPDYAIADGNRVLVNEFKENIPAKYMFDVVSSQFCLHYFFESEIKLRTLLRNVNDNLKIGGYMIGTCFDGERVKDALGKSSSIDGHLDGKLIWKIDKLYSGAVFNSPRSQFNKMIDVFVSSIGVAHKEALVNFNFFEKMMEEYGFKKVMITNFSKLFDEFKSGKGGKGGKGGTGGNNYNKNLDSISQISEDEKKFSFLNNAFIFQKISNLSDNITL